MLQFLSRSVVATVLATTVSFAFAPACAHAQSAQELVPQRILQGFYGSGVALSGDVAIITGAPVTRHPNNTEISAPEVLRFNGTDWQFDENIFSNDPVYWNDLSTNVVLVDSLVAIGAPATARGAAMFFQYDGAVWQEEGPVQSPSPTTLRNHVGYFVAMSEDVLVLGDNDDWDGFSTRQYAFVYRRSGTTWAFEDSLTIGNVNDDLGFGVSVATAGDIVVVGAPFYSVAPPPVTREGAAYVFEYNGTAWEQTQMLDPGPHRIPDMRFGQTVLTDGNTIVVGAVRDSVDGLPHAGAAYVFRKDGANWTLRQRLSASDPAAYANFSISGALSENYLLLGAPADVRFPNTGGAAYFFRFDGNNWVQRSRAVHPDPTENDRFGQAVAMDGGWALVGAPGRFHGQWRAGSAYIFPIGELVSNDEPRYEPTQPLVLQPAYPNPFAGAVRTSVHVANPGHLRIDVYDVLGRQIASIAEGYFPAGTHEFEWRPARAPAGVYTLRATTPRASATTTAVRAK